MKKRKTATGAKAMQRQDSVTCPHCDTKIPVRIDRIHNFKKWHTEQLPRWCYQMDLDVVEYRIINGERVPVAVLEVSRFDMGKKPSPAYFQSWMDRIHERDDNAAKLKLAAEMLCVDAYLVGYLHPSLLEFYVFNLSTNHGWVTMDTTEFIQFISGLKAVKRFDPDYVPPWFY